MERWEWGGGDACAEFQQYFVALLLSAPSPLLIPTATITKSYYVTATVNDDVEDDASFCRPLAALHPVRSPRRPLPPPSIPPMVSCPSRYTDLFSLILRRDV